MRRTYLILNALLLSATLSPTASGDDWPQWLGPQRDSTWRETGIVDKFPEAGLQVKWRTPIGGGYAGPAVVKGKVYVTDYQIESGKVENNPGNRTELNGRERVLCLDGATGKILWKHEYACPYKISYACGPRATPTVSGGKVYTLGAEGNLICFDAAKGDVLWSKELKKAYQVEAPIWGFCAHPLIDGPRLICLVGGEGSVAVAFDKDTGKELWRSLNAPDPGYCPPTIIEAGGTRQLLIWHPESLNSLDPETGKLYWSQPLKPGYGMSITAPRKSGDYLFASAIGNTAALFKLAADKPGAEVEWRATPKSAVFCANSTPVIDGGVIYAACCQVGSLRAVKLETGDRLWESFVPTTHDTDARRASHGTAFLVRHHDRYFLFSETGDLILAKLSAEKYDEISRFHVLEPTGECFGRNVVWSHPAFANKSVYARNDKEIVCVSLEKK